MCKDSANTSLWAVARQCNRELINDESLRDGSEGDNTLDCRSKEEGEEKVVFNNVLRGGSVGASAHREYKLGEFFLAKGMSGRLNFVEQQPSSGWPGERNF